MATLAIALGTTLKVSCKPGSFGSSTQLEGRRQNLSSASVRAGTPILLLRKSRANCTQSRPHGSILIQCVSASDVGSSQSRTSASGLPLKEIPGDYGLPFFGLLKDKLDYFWFEQLPQFYESRRDKYNSSVYRTNVPPGPPFTSDSRVIVLLDEKVYPVLFDMSKVEKKDTFFGTFVPSLDFTGGHRVLALLDPSEPKHKILKQFAMGLVERNGLRILSALPEAMADTFASWDALLKSKGKVDVAGDLAPGTFKFVVKGFTNVDPGSVGANGIEPSTPSLWILLQILPTTVIPGVPGFLAPFAELLLHTFPIPPFLVKSQYSKLLNFFKNYGTEALDFAEQQFGLDRDEALHNFIYIVIFNAFGGFTIFFPSVLKRLGASSAEFQKELAAEVRQAVAKHGGKISPRAVADMPLVQSTVNEVLRIDSPVPFQYARAKVDFILESYDAAYQIRKGEMLAGYMLTATHDPKVFRDPLTFNPKRFLSHEGKELLKYVLWTNGLGTDEPSVDNKQCPGKNVAFAAACLLVAALYTKYDFLGIDPSKAFLTTLKPAAVA